MDLDFVQRGLAAGFTSIMYDGSTLPAEENIVNTQIAVVQARKTGASVEAEIGSMGIGETGEQGVCVYTDPQEAADFVNITQIDALACAFGTSHGFYTAAPKLDFDRLSKIKAQISVPIVMHGGSGVSEEDYRKAIECGVRKVNYYTYMAKAGADAVSNKIYNQFHDAISDGELAIKNNVKKRLVSFQSDKIRV